MALDFTKPVTTDNYSTGILQGIRDAHAALAQWLSSDVAGTLTGTPTGAIRRQQASNGAVERFNGTSWVGVPINGIEYSGGQIGVATAGSTLTELLQVGPTGTAANARIAFRNANADWYVGALAAGGFQLFTAQARGFQISTSNALRFDVAANGHIGIGAVADGWPLDVNGGGRFRGGSSPGTVGEGVEVVYTSGQGYVSAYNRAGAAYTPINLRGSTLALHCNAGAIFQMDAGGRSAFGGITPIATTRLAVEGSGNVFEVRSASEADEALIFTRNLNAAALQWYVSHNGVGVNTGNIRAGYYRINTNGSPRVAVLSDGKTLVGYTADTFGSLFQVNGSIGFPALNALGGIHGASGGSDGFTVDTDKFIHNYGLSWKAFTGLGGPAAALSGYGGIKFYTTGALRYEITQGGVLQDAAGNEMGYRDMPSSGSFLRGGCFVTTTGQTANAGVQNAVYGIYNNSASSITLTQGSGITMRRGGTASTGNLTIAPYGYVTLWYRTTTELIVNGNLL